MKKLLCLILTLLVLLSFCGCDGNWETVNLKEPIRIADNGIIEKSILEQAKAENAIAIFTGNSNDFSYEWTIFGSDISGAKEINLNVQIDKTAEGHMEVTLGATESFGFSSLLSIYLNEKWNAQDATAYADGKAIVLASITGSKTTILNLYLDGSVKKLTIVPDLLPEEEGQKETTQEPSPTPEATKGQDSYLSKPQEDKDPLYINGKDKYLTDPVPEGKPKPVEPEDQDINKGKVLSCTFSIECSTILNNLSMLDPYKLELLPSNGIILAKTTVTFYEGESVFDVLQRLCREKNIHMEAAWTPIYNSAYVEGIHNLYEFDCGALSGWMYCVNGWYPNYGCSRYQLKDGDVVQWRYTCDLGNDVGGGYAVGG